METVNLKDVKELKERAKSLSDQLNDLLILEASVVIGMLAANNMKVLVEDFGPEAAADWLKAVFISAGIASSVNFKFLGETKEETKH